MKYPESHFRQTVPTAATRVTEEDLMHLHVLRDLLQALNDPNASARALSPHVQRLPVLEARVRQAYLHKVSPESVPSVVQQLASLGNRSIEALLLELMEDLAELASEPAEGRRSA